MWLTKKRHCAIIFKAIFMRKFDFEISSYAFGGVFWGLAIQNMICMPDENQLFRIVKRYRTVKERNGNKWIPKR